MKPFPLPIVAATLAAAAAANLSAQDLRIEVRADRIEGPASRLLTGACIEDVNHEIYGGLYSQMVFGESFQEPPRTTPPKGFEAYGGSWKVEAGELCGAAGDGPKLTSDAPPLADGEVAVEIRFADRRPGNAGLIVRVTDPGIGADKFSGYEVSLDAAGQWVRLGRHRQNWEPIQDSPCEVPVGQWIPLQVRLAGKAVEVAVAGRTVIRHVDNAAPLLSGRVGLRQWQRDARYRNLRVTTAGVVRSLSFEGDGGPALEVSGLWRPLRRGDAAGACAITRDRPFVGAQSQAIEFTGGAGEFGIENQGLNRWGMHFAAGKPYEGVLWARAGSPAEVWVALESADGAQVVAEVPLRVGAGDWQRLEFTLTPAASAATGRFALKLRQPGAVTFGYAFLQPGAWGRFKGLPVRRDVAEALIDQGITLLRYGGSMVNHPGYRWKNMIGPRDRRPPHHGTWYPYSTNGWGILDFLDFCEAAGFESVPDFNINESPQDMADFVEYAKGSATSGWGRKRAEAGRAEPYRLKYLQLGNEERVDEEYAAKFTALAQAIWAKDPDLVLVVGDFAYRRPLDDPFQFQGADSGITTLAAHQRILRLAKEHDREVWFDVHVWTEEPRRDPSLEGMFSYTSALGRLADGARHQVVVFEFNANRHDLGRALGNALAIQAIDRDGRVPVALSANCLQPDGQNDNGWNQGLLFLNPEKVWLQPPGFVTRMCASPYLEQRVRCQLTGAAEAVDACARRSADGRRLVLQVVNPTDREADAQIQLVGFAVTGEVAQLTELSGPLGAVNTAAHPEACVPRQRAWRHGIREGGTRYRFPPRSFTVMRFE